MSKYHAQISLPKFVRQALPKGTFELAYSQHALSAAADDGITPLLIQNLDTSKCILIEVETNNQDIHKVVYRILTGTRVDLCIAVVVNEGLPWRVKTVWANDRNDRHKTLRKHLYDT